MPETIVGRLPGEKRAPSWLGVVGAVWALAVVGGFAGLLVYKNTPGEQRGAPARWPRESGIVRSGDRPTLVMFAHPHCPCTKASLRELNKIAERFRERVGVRVLFTRPDGTEAGWEAGDSWEIARTISGVMPAIDEGGVEAARFGAVTSGQVVLYDAEGRLAFHGGITSERGHEGDSFGSERIVALLGGGAADRDESPVFGCAIEDPKKGSEP